MPKYKIYAGLGGGVNSTTLIGIEEHADRDAANEAAYEYAKSDYENYEGLHGVEDWHDCEQEAESQLNFEDFVDEEDYEAEVQSWAEEYYNECRENWIEYWVEEVEE